MCTRFGDIVWRQLRIKTWLGVDGDWSNSANWLPSLPENGDDVLFGGSGQVTTNLLSGLTVNSMLFTNNGNFTVTGNALVLSDFIRSQGSGMLLTLDLPIQLNASATNTLEATNSSILVSGQLSGDRALLIRGNNSRSAYTKHVYFIGTNLYSGGTRYDRWASGVISNEAALGSGPVRIDYGATLGMAIPNGGTISNEFSLATEDGCNRLLWRTDQSRGYQCLDGCDPFGFRYGARQECCVEWRSFSFVVV